MVRWSRGWTVLPLVFFLFGCGSSDDGQTPESVEQPGESPELALPENGFQVRSRGLMIAPGKDVEFCEIVTIPGSPDQEYWVDGFDVAMTEYSHHLIVSAINTGSEAEALYTDGQIEPCIGAQELVGFGQTTSVTGAQVPRLSYAFPEGVGKTFHGGQKLVFDYHYANSSKEPVPARHAVNFRTTAADNIRRIAQQMSFVNLTINTPPQQQASFTAECTFTQDIMVGSLTRHTHKWGRDFSAYYVGTENDSEHIWTSRDYEADTNHRFETPILMPAGTGFRFRCDFENTTDAPLTFGLKATDEMCILFGLWWKVGDDDPVSSQACLLRTIGEDGIARPASVTPASGG